MPSAPVRSSIAEVVWPAVPEPRASAVLAVLFQLEQTQWWSPEAIRERQFDQLRLLLAHAQRTMPFYRARLNQAGVESDRRLDPSVWSRIPLLARADIQAAGDALLSDSLPWGHGSTGEIFTSGSTGRPIRAVRTQLWELFWSAFTLRIAGGYGTPRPGSSQFALTTPARLPGLG